MMARLLMPVSLSPFWLDSAAELRVVRSKVLLVGGEQAI